MASSERSVRGVVRADVIKAIFKPASAGSLLGQLSRELIAYSFHQHPSVGHRREDMNTLSQKAVHVQHRLLDSKEHAGEAAIPEVAEDAAAVIGELLAALKGVERSTRADEKSRCARVAMGVEKPAERHWVPGSLYDKIRREIGAEILRPDSSAQSTCGNCS